MKVRFRLGGKQTFELRRDAERFCKLLDVDVDVDGPHGALEQLQQLAATVRWGRP